MEKICTECGLEKPICEFVRNNTKKDGYTSYCKECHRKRCLKYYYNNKTKYRDSSKRKRNLIKQYINNIKQKGCSMCGEKDIACLDFHHINNKVRDVSSLIKNENLNKVKLEIEKCIVLCSNCHRKLHYKQNYD